MFHTPVLPITPVTCHSQSCIVDRGDLCEGQIGSELWVSTMTGQLLQDEDKSVSGGLIGDIVHNRQSLSLEAVVSAVNELSLCNASSTARGEQSRAVQQIGSRAEMCCSGANTEHSEGVLHFHCGVFQIIGYFL